MPRFSNHGKKKSPEIPCLRYLLGNGSKRLNGVEPSHMPPEGIALSTELQTHSGCVQGKLIVSLNSLNYPSTERGKSKVLFHPLCGLSQQCVFLLRSLLYPAAAHAAETIRAANAAAVTAPVPSASPVATDT